MSFRPDPFRSTRRRRPVERRPHRARISTPWLEPLEDRRLLSASPQLLEDINIVPLDARPSQFVNANGTVFFTASDRASPFSNDSGYSLWKTDGTTDGTSLLKDFPAGGASRPPQIAESLGGTVYLSYTDTTGSFSWWQSDGTVAGTVQVEQLPTLPPTPSPLTAPDGITFGTVGDPSGNYKVDLTATDGTGVTTVLHVFPGLIGSGIIPQPVNNLTLVGDTLFFAAYDPTYGKELWKSDGTVGGTVMVKDINPGPGGSTFNYDGSWVSFDGTLLFDATDGTHGEQLWASDGTAAGTGLLTVVNNASRSAGFG
jgi:ELWxxDGT repeat protein